jgi:hypothetical protein
VRPLSQKRFCNRVNNTKKSTPGQATSHVIFGLIQPKIENDNTIGNTGRKFAD